MKPENRPMISLCSEPGCNNTAVGIWAWKALDMTIGVAYCEKHSDIIRAKLERAGRLAGGTAIVDLQGGEYGDYN